MLLKEALNYYLNNSKRDGCLKRFLELNLDGEKGIYNIIKVNDPKIIVKCVYAYKVGISAVKECESGRVGVALTELESAVRKVNVEGHKTKI